MGRKVLLVEDDFYIRDMYRMVMETHDHKVVTATDGKAALQIFVQEQPEIVYLDIMLPELNGIEVLKAIRAQQPPLCAVPVIMLTNLDSDESIKQCMMNGATAYLIKAQQNPMTVVAEMDKFFVKK